MEEKTQRLNMEKEDNSDRTQRKVTEFDSISKGINSAINLKLV